MKTIQNKFIAVEGVIGVGKTTLARLLAKQFQAKLVLEVVEENPFLKEFYDDIEGKSFQTQIFFLLSRYKQMKKFFQTEMFRSNIVSDYIFMKDAIFANMTLNSDEIKMYNAIFPLLKEKILQPDLVVYLYADLDVIVKRIQKRDRSFERNIEVDYLKRLSNEYDNFFYNFDEFPVLKVDTNQVDFTKTTKQFDKLCTNIKKMLLK